MRLGRRAIAGDTGGDFSAQLEALEREFEPELGEVWSGTGRMGVAHPSPVPSDMRIERAAKAARQAYCDFLGPEEPIPWAKSQHREAWRVVAQAVLVADGRIEAKPE